jgi:hypothetical protein
VRWTDGQLDPRELEQLAAAAGVAPATVRRAVAAVEARAGDPGTAGFITGRLGRLVFDVPIDRMPPNDALPRMAAILESALGAKGEVEVDPTGLLWRVRDEHREIRVTLYARPGGGALRVEESLRRLGAALFGGVVGGLGGGIGGPTAALVAVGLGAPAAAGFIAVGAVGGAYWWAKRRFVAESRRRRFQLALVAHVLASAMDTTA